MDPEVVLEEATEVVVMEDVKEGGDLPIRYYGPSHTAAKLMVILLLILVIIGVVKDTDTMCLPSMQFLVR